MRLGLALGLLLLVVALTAMGGKPSVRKRIESQVKAFIDAGGAPGVVIAGISPAGTFFYACGKDPAKPDRVLTEHTPYLVASVSKVFTAVGLAGMVHDGLLSLDDPADRHLPGGLKLPTRGGKAVELRHLATHTGGLPEFGRGSSERAKGTEMGWEWIDTKLPSLELTTTPGGEVRYSNLGMALLGRVLELRSGTTYEEVVRQRILAPSGMTETAITRPEGAEKPVFAFSIGVFGPAGGFNSTAADLARFARAALGEAPAPLKSAFELTYERQAALGEERHLHLGWWEDNEGRLSHEGLQHAFVGIDRKHNVAAVVLLTGQTDQVGALGRAIMTTLSGRKAEFPKPRPVAKLAAEALRRCEGDYAIGGGKGRITVTSDAARGCLLLAFDGKGASVMWPESATVFFCKEWKCDLVFPAGDGPAPSAKVVMPNWTGEYSRTAGTVKP